MTAPGNDRSPNGCTRIVQTRPGHATGETFYKTADGRWWRDAHYFETEGTCPAEVAYRHNEWICSHK